MPAGERKMPDPIVEPTRTATVLSNPSWRRSGMNRGTGKRPLARAWGNGNRGTASVGIRASKHPHPGARGPRVASALRYGDFTVFRLQNTIPLRLNLFWLAVVCCVIAQIEIVRSTFKVPPPSDGTVPAPSRWSEVLWTVVPAIGLAIVLAFTWRAIHARQQTDAILPAASSVVSVEQPIVRPIR